MKPGEPSVIMAGPMWMPKWPAETSATPDLVRKH